MLIFPVFIPQKGCPFHCVFCDQKQFNSVKEVNFKILNEQIQQFCAKHKNEQKQIAFYGGTFTGLAESERDKYYKLVSPYLDSKTSIRISTRPDAVEQDDLDWCKSHHIKTIELGIQDFSDEVLKASRRGYDSKTAIEACFRVKQAEFELGVQLMPGLPGSSPLSHRESSGTLQGVLPDFVRLYPLIILRGTPLWKEWEKGNIEPLTLEEAINICVEYYDIAERNNIAVIKTGIPSLESSTEYVGPYHPAFGELVKGERLIRKIESEYKSGEVIQITMNDISLLTGHQDYNLRKLMKRLRLKHIKLKANTITIERNQDL